MKAIKVYIPLDELSQYIKSKLPADELADIADSTLVPLRIGLNESDMSVEALVVVAKNGNIDNKRYRMTDAQPQEEYEQPTFDFGDEV